MKVLLDTNVILDFFLNRQPFVVEATRLWQANRLGQFEGFIAAITPLNLDFISRKIIGKNQSKQAVEDLLLEFKVCPVDYAILEVASKSAITDFEDAVQHESAVRSGIDIIVTRDITDFRNATLTVLSPIDFLSQLPSTNI